MPSAFSFLLFSEFGALSSLALWLASERSISVLRIACLNVALPQYATVSELEDRVGDDLAPRWGTRR
jgi:HAMP domain-containing protein